jgi:hypothetical protein
MSELDTLYAQLLHLGLSVLRQAHDEQDNEWVAAEIEFLHNVPSLLGEENVHRHRYFWLSERQTYIDWVSAPGRERANSRAQTFYAPVWREMEPLMTELFELCDSREGA